MMQYRHITIKDRNVIQKMFKNEYPIAAIASILKFHRGTIYREINRNSIDDEYYSGEADDLYKKRRSKNQEKKLYKNIDLNLYVVDKLKSRWSPEQIENRLKIDFPNDLTMRISYETIYKEIYYGTSLGCYYIQFLRQKRRKRQKRSLKNNKRVIIKDKKSIHTRPDEADTRSVIGHWEADTVEGKGKSGYFATFVDRKFRYLAAAKTPRKEADSMIRATLEAFGSIENDLIKTITADNGTEFARFKNIEEALECSVYFADPYSSWQRGTNENTNGLLRQYFPKNKKFTDVTEYELERAVAELNNRPRKCLNYLTPYEAFFGLKCVALQT